MLSVISPTRADLSAAFPNNPKLVRAFEQLFRQTVENTSAVSTGAEATQALQDATVVTLSSNDTFTNERVLAVSPGLSLTDTGENIILALVSSISTNGGRCTFDLDGDTEVSLPTDGRVFTSTAGPFANDAAAATGGIAVGEMYKVTGGTIAWRQV